MVEMGALNFPHSNQMDVSDIGDLNLNDSEIIQTLINSAFEVELLVNYILDYASQKTALYRLVFQHCLSAELQLRLAFQGPNSILRGHEEPEPNGYRKFIIETNTTASLLTIIAKHLKMIPASDG
ncbi:MAG: hypothetical protein JWR15_2494 [Prosthecobacter sp.]|nr:hypothetical protein [Prosthecobacter sp.]